jgi:Ser/Thr protein kinase RdoA (MazF antagonist)
LDPQLLIDEGWEHLGDHRGIASRREVSAQVSTNRVYELTLTSDHQIIAKTSSYGNYVHFRQDHQLIHQWSQALAGRYANFMARIVLKGDRVFAHRDGDCWVTFYEKVPFYDFLPRVLSASQVRSLGSEMARFHRASFHASKKMNSSWKSVGADIGTLHAAAGRHAWRRERGLPDSAESSIRHHCEAFLENAEHLGYHGTPRIPVLLDWNTGNFSVGLDRQGFKFFSRWDYDWFRVEPRTFDFYFCARVVREGGDQTEFSYLADPFLEPRFAQFLEAYHKVYPLSENDLLFLKEAYRFFILNYVVHTGEHFFRPSFRQRLLREAMEVYLPALESVDLRPLVDRLLG